VVLFGGIGGEPDDPGYLDDTWEWDGRSWTRRDVAGPSPPPMFGHDMVYDTVGHRVLLYGGCLAHLRPSPEDDRLCVACQEGLWAWDGENWSDVSPAGDQPARRTYHGMAYDTVRERLVVFGGFFLDLAQGMDGLLFRDDVWEFDGVRWQEITPVQWRIGPRSNIAMAYDAAHERVVLASGRHLFDMLQETWLWDGRAWTDVNGATAGKRSGHTMAYDSTRRRAVVFGGRYESGLLLDDTWMWQNPVWHNVSHAGSPPARTGHTSVFQPPPGRDRTLLFGGCGSLDVDGACVDTLADTWEWDGRTWQQQEPAQAPPPRWGHALAWDAGRTRAILFAGRTDADGDGASEAVSSDTWAWTAGGWEDVSVGSSPPPRTEHALVYDEVRDRIVLLGGEDADGRSFDDTWEWTGAAWVEVEPHGGRPLSRSGHSMAWDAVRGRSMALWGWSRQDADALSYIRSLTEWDGTRWTDVTPLSGNTPFVRRDFGLVFDTVRDRLFLFGGQSLRFTHSDTWEWESDPNLRPGVTMEVMFDLPEAHLSELHDLTFRTVAGGRGYTVDDDPSDDGDAIGDAADGAQLLAWDAWGARWSLLADSPAGSDAPAPLDWRSGGPGEAARYVLERDRRLHLLVRSTTGMGNGPEPARVVVDYLEARLRYRWPEPTP